MNALSGPVVRHWVLWVAGGFVVAWLVGIAWWAMLGPTVDDRPGDVVIPPGAAELIAQGRRVPGVPSTIRANDDGFVRITNNDTAEHYIGGALIRPGASAVIKPVETDGQVSCSFHSAGSIGIELDERPPFRVTIVPALILGVPFGLAFGGAVFVARRLGHEDDLVDPAHL